jgi:beta-glucanase (GH16 family)
MSQSITRATREFRESLAFLRARTLLTTLAFAGITSACAGDGVLSPPVETSPPAGPGEPAIDEAGGIPAGAKLVWSDEFDVAGLPDAKKWSYDTGRNAAGWYNHELQYYAAARAANSRVGDGMLVLTARREDLSTLGLADWGGQKYSSARLVTRGKAAWTHGFIEVRAKLPCGRGTWPAIWMLSAPPQGRWPEDGEIDIMEHVGFDPGVVHATAHTGAYNHVRGNQRTATHTLADACDEFHRYQLHWTPMRITIGIDDRNYYQYSNDGSGNAEWPFDSPQYLILNVAVGGDWGGQRGVDDSVYPVSMQIDYVRVYQ